MVLVKNVKFLHRFFRGKIGRQILIGDLQESKLAFLDYKSFHLRK